MGRKRTGKKEKEKQKSTHMIIQLPKNHNKLSLDILRPSKRVIILALAQRARVDISRKVAHRGRDAGIQRTAVCEVAAETHARCADASVAGFQALEEVDREGGVFIVGGELFGYLVGWLAVLGAEGGEKMRGKSSGKGKGNKPSIRCRRRYQGHRRRGAPGL